MTSSAALAAARHLGAAAPERPLPCPACGASVKGANLERHLAKAHPGAPTDDRGLVGADRRIRRTLGGLAVTWVAALVAVVVLDEDRLAAAAEANRQREGAGELLTRFVASPFALGLVAGALVLGGALLALRLGLLRARLDVRGDEVLLRHRLGTGLRRARLGGPVETGALVVRRPRGSTSGGDGGGGSVDELAGAYLRVGGRRAVTVGCAHGTRLRRHWTGWTAAGRRRRWDVTLAPGDFVSFQYALAAAGCLAARDQPSR